MIYWEMEKKYLKGPFIKMLQTGAPRGLTLFQRFRKVTHCSYKVCERGGMFQMKVDEEGTISVTNST